MTPNNPPRLHNPRCAVCTQPCTGGVEYCWLTGEFVCGSCLAALSISLQGDGESQRNRGGWWRGLLKIGLLAKIAPVFSRLTM
jgi:hypothetical protein